MSRILVTGADGFIGQRFCSAIEQRGHSLRRTARSESSGVQGETVGTGDLAKFAGWQSLVSGVDTVVHLAARAHVIAKGGSGDVESYRPTNVDATIALAEAASAQKVRRFVFMSSIGVNGNQTKDAPFTETSVPAPVDAYAISKWHAEQALVGMFAGSGTELVIVRPPLVYGPGVKGNLLRLLKLVASGFPLPLGALRAPRSFIGRDNLCDLLIACVEHPKAAGEVFLAAEPERRSTAELLEAIVARMPSAGRVWRCPLPLLRFAAALTGRQEQLEKLSTSLEVDPAKAIRILGWNPVVPFRTGMDEAVDWFVRTHRR